MDEDSSRRLVLLTVVSLVIAVAALAVAGWTLYTTNRSEEYDAAQIADAKATVCGAADIVRKGVSLNTNLRPEGGSQDVTGAQAVAANARISLYDGGQYLLQRLAPATPPELAEKVRQFANNLMDIGAHATAGVPNDDPAQAKRLADADAENKAITALCK
ncbi:MULTISPECIES: hypothetical protein [unclassified Mycobacterium]|uniref:hypothetical protein n=1 Tax=unclassified Mycobacterium TaxID=2642494 RepID=UPI00073FE82D|nr:MULTISPECIES: hypothetical protein [unclassified Mycobacterium]KUH87596.1 hypothetical protein AU186_03150 [Mycobacterium sp. GA-1999]KUH90227.1 hypothetical protein AU187_22050 [Mycobacterium sp. IS-1556]KUH90872.1 hypothetical protein AU185_04055 [Mycobacterium sp. GA-0227b]